MVDYTYKNIYKNKTVLVTGHTGFKGSWLCVWLEKLGAKVIGYSLAPNTKPNHYELLNLNITSIIGDILDKKKLNDTFNKYKPEVVFHLAAQPLVRYSYKNPVETFETNMIGTINIFEACKKFNSVKAIVNITSDKAYHNQENKDGYKETDPMGGYDPYSASKGCCELITQSYRHSFFTNNNILLASCRAGNVIGGGDWAEDRLVCDIFRSINDNQKVQIRNPNAIRPWQYILDVLSGYLLIGQKLLEKDKSVATAWNFGPKDNASINVQEVLDLVKLSWNKLNYIIQEDINNPYETSLLRLDCSKAKNELEWDTKYDINKTFENTATWYKEFYENNNLITLQQIDEYIKVKK